MLRATTHIDIMIRQHILNPQTFKVFSWNWCVNRKFSVGLLHHFKCHMKQLMTHSMMVYLARKPVSLYTIIKCKPNITHVMW